MNFLDHRQISIAKGIAIIGVIAIHLIDPLLLRNVFSALNLSTKIFAISMYELSLVAVPLFLFLSALLFKEKHLQHLDQYLFKRLRRLIIPYLIWTPIYIKFYPLSPQPYTLEQLHTFVLFGWSHLYFIVLMIQFAVLAPFAYRIMSRSSALIVSLSFQFLLLGYFYLQTVLTNTFTFQHHYLFSICIFWVGYYCLGSYLSQRKLKYNVLLPLSVCVISLCFIFWDACVLFYGKQIPPVYALGYFRPSVLTFSVGVIFLLPTVLKHLPEYLGNVLEKFGKLSYGIYLTHLLILKYLLPLFQIKTNNIFGLLLGIMIVLLTSTLVTSLIREIPYLSEAVGVEVPR